MEIEREDGDSSDTSGSIFAQTRKMSHLAFLVGHEQ